MTFSKAARDEEKEAAMGAKCRSSTCGASYWSEWGQASATGASWGLLPPAPGVGAVCAPTPAAGGAGTTEVSVGSTLAARMGPQATNHAPGASCWPCKCPYLPQDGAHIFSSKS